MSTSGKNQEMDEKCDQEMHEKNEHQIMEDEPINSFSSPTAALSRMRQYIQVPSPVLVPQSVEENDFPEELNLDERRDSTSNSFCNPFAALKSLDREDSQKSPLIVPSNDPQ